MMTASPEAPNLTQAPRSTQVATGLTLVVLLALAMRLLAIGRPLLGVFATKNIVYAMIARNLVEGRASFWLPRVDCLCGGQRGLHLLELPLSAYLAGELWRVLGGSLEVWGRAVSIGLSLAAILVLFDLVRRRHGPSAALGAAMVLALSPVAVIYGQHFMLEASVVFLAVATIDAVDRWLCGRRTVWLVLGGVCFALLVLTKIYMLVLLLPVAYLLFVEGQRLHTDTRWIPYGVLLVFFVAALPAIVWVACVMHASSPGGAAAGEVFYSLRDSTGAHRLPSGLLARPDFYRQVFDDLSTVVLTPVAFMLPVVSLLDRRWRHWAVWLVAMGLLVVAMPRKFYEMNYYWLVVLPPVAILAGLGWAWLAERLRPSRVAVAMLVALGVVASLRYTAGPLLRTAAEDRAVLPAAEAVRRLSAEGEPVVTMHGSGVDLLYYCDRPGWALEPDEPELAERLVACRRAGARLLAIVDVGREESPDRVGRLLVRVPVAEGEGYRVYAIDGGR